MNVFLLTREVGNGEYLEQTHLSAYPSFLTAIRAFNKLVPDEEKSGTDAPNCWTRIGDFIDYDEENPEKAKWIWKNEMEYHTGNWGYIRYTIKEVQMELDEKNNPKDDYEDWLLFLKRHETDLSGINPEKDTP